jgi:hypothetical protein
MFGHLPVFGFTIAYGGGWRGYRPPNFTLVFNIDLTYNEIIVDLEVMLLRAI